MVVDSHNSGYCLATTETKTLKIENAKREYTNFKRLRRSCRLHRELPKHLILTTYYKRWNDK